jgi:hypothetical protein
MTNMPEAKLAREAELCYATLALATDYDVWHESHETVTVEAVIAHLLKNVVAAKEVLRRVIPTIGPPRACGCPELLKNAIITSPTAFAPKPRKALDLLIGKYFPGGSASRSRRRGEPTNPNAVPGPSASRSRRRGEPTNPNRARRAPPPRARRG